MKITRRLLLLGSIAFFGPFGLLSTAARATDSTFDVVAAISAAVTKADHEKIAAFYAQEAMDLDAKVAQHQKMSQAYRLAGKGRHSAVSMNTHCEKLLGKYKAAAAENRDLAKAHQDLAIAAPP